MYGRDLVAFDVSTGRARILDEEGHLVTFALSPDSSRIAFTSAKRFERAGSQQVLYDLNTIVLVTGQKSTVARDTHFALLGNSFTWSPDGSRLAYQTDGSLEEKNDCYIADVGAEDAPRNITAFPPGNPGARWSFAPVWDSAGQTIYIIRDDAVWKVPVKGGKVSRLGRIPGRRSVRLISQDDGSLWSTDGGRSATVVTNDSDKRQDGFYKIDLTTGESSVLLENGSHYWEFSIERYLKVAPNGRAFLYSAQDLEHPADLWISDADFAHPRRVSHVNPAMDHYGMGRQKLIQWLSLDGEMLRGFLILPPDFEDGKKYPMIVSVYGGQFSSSTFGFMPAVINMQLLATRGYVVFEPDAPQRLGTPMLDLAKTVLPGVNKVIEMGIADPKRLGVIGHSYGGYSVLSLLVQTPRFSAAVMSAGYGDLISEYGQMDEKGSALQTSILEQGPGLIGGTPWEYRDRYIENSPILHLDRIQTPLLIAHGGGDTNVAPFLADEVFVGMRRLGKEVVYAKYAGEGHSPLYWSYPSQLDFCTRVISWFDAHLK